MSIYDEIEIEDMTFIAGERGGSFTYPCPCGDRFILSAEELLGGEDVAPCPSCSLRIRIVFDADTLEDLIAAAQQKQAAGGDAAAPPPAAAAAAAASES
jgi:diphthamide biosynthesis protein 3